MSGSVTQGASGLKARGDRDYELGVAIGETGGERLGESRNVAMCCASREISWYVNGAIPYLSQPGAYASGNIIDTGGTRAESSTSTRRR
jgi:hypothetical protein